VLSGGALNGLGTQRTSRKVTRSISGLGLRYAPDPKKPTHGFIEPSRPMSIEEYQRLLAETAANWRKL
jgi:hypothetical protein